MHGRHPILLAGMKKLASMTAQNVKVKELLGMKKTK
jgi:hypothetical protein